MVLVVYSIQEICEFLFWEDWVPIEISVKKPPFWSIGVNLDNT